MGVKGLWRLLANCGTPVSLESLEHKILAVDVSIWLHQAVRGFKGFGSGSVANAHLLTLFHRICKLLFYRIRPVFVFDGGVPQLKRQTLSSRRLRREAAAGKAQKVRDRLLSNLLRSQAVRNALGKKGPGPTMHRVSKPVKQDKDLFELPPLPKELNEINLKPATAETDSEEEDIISKNLSHKDLHNFEYDDNEFQSLSLETQHEILSELQVTRKENSWHTLNEMPQEYNSFSSFQMGRLLKRYKFQKTLDNVRSEIRKINTAEMEAQLFGDLEKHVSLTHKIVSEDSAHSILVKNIKESTIITEGIQIESSVEKSSKSYVKQDFLTELAKQGIVSSDFNKNGKRDFESSFSASSDDDYDSLSDEDLPQSSSKKKKVEEVAFLKAMDYMLDDSEITQEEIYSLIKQTKFEVESESLNLNGNNKNYTKKNADLHKPSTSANAPGEVYNSDVESSTDDEDFIDVFDHESGTVDTNNVSCQPFKQDTKISPQKLDNLTLEESNSNVDKILGAKTDSLYIKILQQKLGDVVQTSNTKSSIDTRKPCQENNLKQNLPSPSKGSVTISINFKDSPQKPFEDDIFKDVFNHQKMQKVNNHSYDETNGNFIKEKITQCSENVNSITEIEKKSPLANNDIDIKTLNVTDQLKEKVTELIRKEVENMLKISSLQNLPHQTLDKCESLLKNNDSIASTSTSILLNMETDDPVNKEPLDEHEGVLDSEAELYEAKTSKLDSIVNKKVTPSCNSFSINVDGDLSNAGKLMESQKNIEIKDGNLVCSSIKENIRDEAHVNLGTLDKDFKSVEKPSMISITYTMDDLKHMENELSIEQNNLVKEIHEAERVAVDISDQVYGEAQDLLKIFGLPYLVAPMEAEAQCAFLDMVGLTHGTITNDSDIFLFGGKRVYKNFFNQDKHVECFTVDNFKHNLGLDRNKMITLAMLTGSDYSIGIESVGAVLGMEILSEFPGTGSECLKNLKKWWNSANKNVGCIQSSKTKQRLTRLYLPEFFPNENIFNAYLQPEVDESLDKFTWGIPKVENLRTFTAEKFGWNMLKTDEIILPVFKKLGVSSTQMRIDSYFNNIKLVKEPHNKSQRLKDAITRAKEEAGTFTESVEQSSSNKNKTSKRILLMDPSEGNYGKPERKKRGRKVEKASSNEENKKKTIENSQNDRENKEKMVNTEETVEISLSKEEKKEKIYKKLQEKEKITQLEKEKMEKNKKKALAVKILSKSKTKK